MTDHALNNIEFGDKLFKNLDLSIKKSQQRISYIADGGVNKGQAVYQRAIEKFNNELKNDLNENSIFTWHEILYITNEISINKELFNTLVKFEKFEKFILRVVEYKRRQSINKKLFHIYFNYYTTLHKNDLLKVLKMYLNSVLRRYDGKNRYIKNLVAVKEHIFEKLPNILIFFNNDFDIIKNKMKLQDDFEFSKALLNLKIIQELKSLKYDEENQNIFSTIIDRKEMFFDDGLTLKEYVGKYLIDIAMHNNLPFPNWQIFILKLIGDPRSTAMHSSTMRSWDIIGEDKKSFFIKTLSKDDLKLFLEALSDSVSDTNYHYRKAFWMQFLEKVVFAKIMIGANAYNELNDAIKEKFKLNNESYSELIGNPSQSAIYIDFGIVKVIEFTHNGSVRFYNECPIDLHKKEFRLNQSMKTQPEMIKAIRHHGAKNYNWQKYALNIMNKKLNTNITKNDIEIPEDKNKREAYTKRVGKYI